jgi:hypothetical protein
MSDFKNRVAHQAATEFNARRAALQADFAAHEHNGDEMSAAQTMQELAKLDLEEQAAANLYNRHVASQQPRQREYLTPEERAAKPIHKMDWSDTVDLTRQSKYAKNIRADDPNMIAGWHESQRRRSRGE